MRGTDILYNYGRYILSVLNTDNRNFLRKQGMYTHSKIYCHMNSQK